MKCDELEFERLGEAKKTYPASTLVIRKQYVDAAIAELKARIHELESIPHTDNSAVINLLSDELEKLRPMEAALEIAEADNKKYIERIKELEVENERLKNEKKKMYTKLQHDTIIDAMSRSHLQKLRSTKRALWLARANYCHNFRIDWYLSRHPHSKMSQSVMENTLIMAEMNCRKKARKYE